MSAIEKHNKLVDGLEEIFKQMDIIADDVEKEIMEADNQMKALNQLKSSLLKYSIFQKIHK